MYKYACACQVVRGCIVVLIFQPCWFSIISRNQLKSPLLIVVNEDEYYLFTITDNLSSSLMSAFSYLRTYLRDVKKNCQKKNRKTKKENKL